MGENEIKNTPVPMRRVRSVTFNPQVEVLTFKKETSWKSQKSDSEKNTTEESVPEDKSKGNKSKASWRSRFPSVVRKSGVFDNLAHLGPKTRNLLVAVGSGSPVK